MTAWKNDFIDINLYARSGKKITGVKKLVLHYTANPGGSAANHKTYFGTTLPVINKQLIKDGKKPRYASAHIFVDTKEAICILPLNEVAYHANDVQKHNADGSAYRGVKELKPNANLLSIGVEMCVEKDGSISPTTIQRTIDVFVELCETYNLTEKDIVRHFDISAKNCPAPFVDDEELFEDFKKQVGLKLGSPQSKPTQTQPVTPSPSKPKSYLEKGDKGDSVKELQALLEKLGYDVGAVDGIFGNATDTQVRKFQKDNKLAVDGLAGNGTVNALREKVESLTKPQPKPVEAPKSTETKAPVKPTSPPPVKKTVAYPGHVIQKGSKDTVSNKLIQKALGITADGIFGDMTDKKVKEFQLKNKLSADGDVGKLTWNKLFN
jgi:N-acetylmuramoyl-L-alanine amidase